MAPPPSGEHLFPVPLGLRQAVLSQAVVGSAASVRRVEGCVDGTQRAGASPLHLPAHTHSPGLIVAQIPGKPQQRGVLLHTRPPTWPGSPKLSRPRGAKEMGQPCVWVLGWAPFRKERADKD